MKFAAELSHFSSFCPILNLFCPRAAVAFRQTKMQRLLLEKELVIGARGSYGLFCQSFLKGHGTFSFPLFSLTRSSETTRIFSHWNWRNIWTGKEAQLYGANQQCASCLHAVHSCNRVTSHGQKEGGCLGHFGHFSRYRGHRNFICTLMCTNPATDAIGTGRTGDVIDSIIRSNYTNYFKSHFLGIRIQIYFFLEYTL